MVIDTEFNKHEEIQKFKSNHRKYIVLDATKFKDEEDTQKFKNSIEVLDMINTINWANDFYKSVNSNLKIDTSIIYKSIDAGFTNKPFTDEQLQEYYNTTVSIEWFFASILKFVMLENYTPYELEFILFGLSYKEQSILSKEQKDTLHDTYGDLFYDVRMKTIDVKTFIKKIKVLIKELKTKNT